MSYTSTSHNQKAQSVIAEHLNDSDVRRRRRGIAAGAAAVIAAGALIGANTLHDNNQQHEARLKALKEVDTPVFRTIVLRGGTQLRVTPKELTVSASSGDTANLAGEIPKDEVWVAQAPLVDLERPQWVAITPPKAENDIHSLAERADKTVWVHYGPFISENKGGGLDWKFNEDGSTSVNGDLTPVVGSTFSVDAQSLAVVDNLADRK